MNKPIRILIVDDQELFREALCTLLSVQEDFNIVAQAGNGEEAVRMAVYHQPDVILMDLRMPVMDGAAATRRIRDNLVDPKIIVLTTFDDDDSIYDGLSAGAVGYLLKDASPGQLYEAIRAASRGEYFLLPKITARVVAEYSKMTKPSQNRLEGEFPFLSRRELEILNFASKGASNREIAEQLVIAEGTVKNHMRSILGKLEVKDRMQAVLKAKELGIIS
jgi:DNA-binding NarL/FixJ family response regulator